MRALFAAVAVYLMLMVVSVTPPQKAAATHTQAKVDGHSAGYWRWIANRRGARIRNLEGTLHKRWNPSLLYGIRLAAEAYGQSAAELRRVAFCESRFFLFARSSGGHVGPFQYAWGTWRSTPYAEFSPFDPIAAPLATGWMWSAGRKGEWACA